MDIDAICNKTFDAQDSLLISDMVGMSNNLYDIHMMCNRIEISAKENTKRILPGLELEKPYCSNPLCNPRQEGYEDTCEDTSLGDIIERLNKTIREKPRKSIAHDRKLRKMKGMFAAGKSHDRRRKRCVRKRSKAHLG